MIVPFQTELSKSPATAHRGAVQPRRVVVVFLSSETWPCGVVDGTADMSNEVQHVMHEFGFSNNSVLIRFLLLFLIGN